MSEKNQIAFTMSQPPTPEQEARAVEQAWAKMNRRARRRAEAMARKLVRAERSKDEKKGKP